MDLSTTIAPKSDQLNADDLLTGERTIKITGVKKSDTPEQPVSIYFDGDNGKPFKPCKSMRRVLVHVWGKDASLYAGRSMTIYCDPSVKFGGMEVGGIRISHMSDISKPVTLALTASKANKKPYTIKPLDVKSEPVIYDELKNNAYDAAGKGVEAYKEFLAGLNESDKNLVRPLHKELSELAKSSEPENESAPI